MNKKQELTRQLGESILAIGRGHDAYTSIRATSQEEVQLLELYKSAGILVHFESTNMNFMSTLNDIKGKLMLLSAMGVLSKEELNSFLVNIQKIEEL